MLRGAARPSLENAPCSTYPLRAEAVTGSIDDEAARAFELLGIGHKAKLLTPELLARRIEVVTGLKWTRNRNPDAAEQLSADGVYSVFFGGIDSETVTLRSREPVAIRAAVARRLGHDLSCVLVPQEFAIVPLDARRLFRLIDLNETPLLPDGSIDAIVETRVLAQIRRLHAVLWAEPTLDADEVQASYALFLAAIRELKNPADGSVTTTNLPAPCQALSKFVATADGVRPPFPAAGTVLIDGVEHRRVNPDPNFTVRAWMAVTSALIADPRFLFE